MSAEKEGRMLSEANARAIAEALRTLEDVMKRAGMPMGDNDSEDEGEDEASKAKASPFADLLQPTKPSLWQRLTRRKHGDEGGWHRWIPGASSFSELDALEQVEETKYRVQGLLGDFSALASNILADEEATPEMKTQQLTMLVDELKGRLGANQVGEAAKAVWTTAYINDLPDSSFLYIEPGGDKDDQGKTTPRSMRHFPVRDAGGAIDLPHLRNAIARIPQSNAPGLTPEKKTALQERARRMLREQQGESARAGFAITKDRQGKLRWVGTWSNKFYDRDGEVIPEAELKAYERAADKAGAYPPLWLFHIPGTELGETDMIAVTDEGMALGTGPIKAGMEQAAQVLAGRDDLGMSHGYEFSTVEADGAIKGVRPYELSVLPLDWAANPYTAFGLAADGREDMDEAKRKFLADVLGEEKATQVWEAAAAAAKGAESAGVAWKDLSKETPNSQGSSEGDNDAAAKAAEPLQALTKAVDELNRKLDEQASALQAQASAIEALQASDDEKLADMLSPGRKPSSEVQRKAASSTDSTVLSDEERAAAEAGLDDKITPAQPIVDAIMEGVNSR